MALFRVDFSGRGELSERQQKLAQMLSRLQKISEEYNMAIFVTNQMTSDPGATMSFQVFNFNTESECVLFHDDDDIQDTPTNKYLLCTFIRLIPKNQSAVILWLMLPRQGFLFVKDVVKFGLLRSMTGTYPCFISSSIGRCIFNSY